MSTGVLTGDASQDVGLQILTDWMFVLWGRLDNGCWSDVSRISSNLADRSKDLKWGAKRLRLQAIYRQYGPVVAVALFVVFVIYIKFF